MNVNIATKVLKGEPVAKELLKNLQSEPMKSIYIADKNGSENNSYKKMLLKTIEKYNLNVRVCDSAVGADGILYLDTDKKLHPDNKKYMDLDAVFAYGNESTCTAQAALEICKFYNIDLEGKIAVVLGRSDLVGRPLVNLLIKSGATVINCNSKTQLEDLIQFCKSADIIFSAVGKPNFITNNFLSNEKEQIIIDIGINFLDGKICGDAQQGLPVYAQTPVPGGVGVVTNAITLLRLIKNS